MYAKADLLGEGECGEEAEKCWEVEQDPAEDHHDDGQEVVVLDTGQGSRDEWVVLMLKLCVCVCVCSERKGLWLGRV